MSYTPQTWNDQDITTPLSGPRMTNIEQGLATAASTADQALATASAATSGVVGGVALDSFAGSTDDAKLTAAISYVQAQTVKPPILFSNRLYSFSQTRSLTNGLKFVGAYGFGNQQRAANSIPNDIHFTGSGTWWTIASSSTFDNAFIGLCLQGNSGAQFLATGANVWWTSVIRDCGFNLWNSVIGSPTTKALVDAVLFDGWWNVNNSYNTAFHMSGSDNTFWPDGMLIGAQPTSIASGAYHIWWDTMQKSVVGPIYLTSETSGGMRLDGNSSISTSLIFTGHKNEGRNTNAPCVGSNLRINGGSYTFRDCWISYGATGLNTLSGRTGELGVITVTGGDVLFDGCWYDRAAGVSETGTPWIGQSGGYVRVRNSRVSTGGGAWSTTPGKPAFHSTGGTYDVDNSVQVI